MSFEGRQNRKKWWATRRRSERAVQRNKDPEDSLLAKRIHARRKDVARYIAKALFEEEMGKVLWR